MSDKHHPAEWSNITFEVTPHFGSIEIKQFSKYENGRIGNYCYSIKRDLFGAEVSRTEPTLISFLFT